ncbi:MAG: amidase [Myxococcota bacterium]
MDELLLLSAVEQSAKVRRREVSAEELTRAYLARIEARNPALSAFVAVAEKSATKAARRLDAQAKDAVSPLFGVPIGIKDLNLVRGMPARMGSSAFRWLVWSPLDDPSARRVRASGAVILGKLSTSEIGILPIVETEVGPPTKNPWALDRTAGGSSGGSASAVAGGMVSIAQGSDAAGSIRIPASFCGLVGFKPSRGALVEPHRWVDPTGIAVEGPIARSTADAAALYDVLRPRPVAPSDSMLQRSERPPEKLRIKMSLDPALMSAEPEVKEAALAAQRALEALGHTVEEAPFFPGEVREFLPIMQLMVRGAPIFFEKRLQPMSQWMRREGRRLDKREVLEQGRRIQDRIDAWFQGADAWLTPTVPVAPPKLGAALGLDPPAIMQRLAPLGYFTAPFNAAGMPAVSLPFGQTSAGLPVGAQLAMARGDDLRLMALARALESAGAFAVRMPPTPPGGLG